MIKFDYTIKNQEGFHATPAAEIFTISTASKSDIYMSYKNKLIKTTNMIGMVGLKIKCGESIKILIEGPDEVEVAKKIRLYCQSNL